MAPPSWETLDANWVLVELEKTAVPQQCWDFKQERQVLELSLGSETPRVDVSAGRRSRAPEMILKIVCKKFWVGTKQIAPCMKRGKTR